ncbi:hypothetical protein BH11ARM2_BH11ARM2_23780 [soil metagenome]
MPDSLTRMLETLPVSFRTDRRHFRQIRVQQELGAAFLVLGGGLFAAGLVIHEPGLWVGAGGPLIAGAVNLVFGTVMRNRFKQEAQIGLSEDGRNLLAALMIERLGSRTRYGGPSHVRWNSAKPLVVVPEPVETQLSRVAEAYLALKAASEAAAESRHGMRARLAADEGLAEGFNTAALCIRQPGAGHEAKLAQLAEGMREAADRLDPRETSPGTLDSLLTDLRDEERARQELNG